MSDVVTACQDYVQGHYKKYGGVPSPMEMWVTAAAWQRDRDYSLLLSMCAAEAKRGPGPTNYFLGLDDAAKAIREQAALGDSKDG